ncbi:RFC checkpoint protein Rad17 [Coemansia sp. RSA 2049]|nr:RFC checkpoint protein Rad17 [Coemansia sp. RSA 2049]
MAPKTRAQSRKQEQTRKRVVIVSSSSPEPPSSAVADEEGLLDGNIAATCGGGNTDDDIFDIEMDSDLEALINECASANENNPLANANSQQNQHQQSQTLPATAPEASSTSSVSSKGKSVPFKRSHSQTQAASSSGRALSDRPRFKLARPTSRRQVQGTTAPTIPMGSPADTDGLVWWQRYEPHTTDELALHAAKIAQVRTWLETATSSGDSAPGACMFRLLVLEGPPGTCKSTSVRVLGAEMGLEIVEWINPLTARQSDASLKHDYANDDGDDGDDMPVGAIRQFDDFLRRAERYSSLSLHPDGIPGGRPGSDSGKKFILIDDLPNIAHHDTREAFGAALSRFVATPASRSFPMVIVVTECFSVHQMLGGDIGDESSSFGSARYRLRTASGNSDSAAWTAADVIPSSVYRSPFCQTIKFNPVAPTIVAKGLKRILQMRATEKGAAGRQNTAAVVKRISAECHGDLRLAVTMLQISGPADSRSASASGSRDQDRDRGAALDLFHALGKVLYAKRAVPPTVGKLTAPRGELESDPDDILDRVPVEPSTFSLFIHENYVDFCSSVDELADAAECLSESDAISSGNGGGGVWSAAGARVSAAYAAVLAVRGIMYVRDHPKYAGNGGSGQAPDNGRRKGAPRQMAAFRKPMFFDSYKRKAAFNGVWQDMMADTAAFGGSGCALDRNSAVLDVLPFWARIISEKQRAQRYSPAHARLLRLATVGREDDSGAGISNAGRWAEAVASSVAAADESPQKLVLSDDDIDEFSD